MGFLADVFLGPQCNYCGRRSLEEEFSVKGYCPFEVKYCRSCGRYQVHGPVPSCHRCGTPQTKLARNEYGVMLPQCPNCGYIWDDD